MHNLTCRGCTGYGWLWTLRAGISYRRPGQVATIRTRMTCRGCAGHGTIPLGGGTISGRRLPAL